MFRRKIGKLVIYLIFGELNQFLTNMWPKTDVTTTPKKDSGQEILSEPISITGLPFLSPPCLGASDKTYLVVVTDLI